MKFFKKHQHHHPLLRRTYSVFLYFYDRITTLNILHFFQQLATLISAGITLTEGLDILMQTQDKPALRSLLRTIRLELESGKEFNHCLRRFPHLFDSFCCQLIHIGERTGSLDIMLKRIVNYKEKNRALNAKIKQALFYPSIILIAAVFTTLVMLFFVVPHFASLFEHYPKKIPILTKGIIYLSYLLHKMLPWIFVISIGMLFTAFYIRKSFNFSLLYQRMIFKLPWLRHLTKKILLAQFARNLATIIASGIPLSEGLKMNLALFKYEELSTAIRKLHTSINSGQHFYSALRSNPFFPPFFIQMVRTGEESGTLDLMLLKLAEMYEADLEQLIIILNQLLEPLIIGILGVLIGGIVIAMYLPIFRLGTVL